MFLLGFLLAGWPWDRPNLSEPQVTLVKPGEYLPHLLPIATSWKDA